MRVGDIKTILADTKLWGEDINKLVPGLAEAIEGCMKK
jgi:hypothetical protein